MRRLLGSYQLLHARRRVETTSRGHLKFASRCSSSRASSDLASNRIFGYACASSPVHDTQTGQRLEFLENERHSLEDVVDAYRRFGYRVADLDPLRLWDVSENKRALGHLFDRFQEQSDQQTLEFGELRGSANQIRKQLESTYCGTLAVEFMHLNSLNERQWWAREFEEARTRQMDANNRREIAELMLKALTLEHFLAAKFPTLKRYSGEGAEAALAFHWHVLQEAPRYNLCDVVWGGAHRGRVALHTLLFGLKPTTVLRKIRGYAEFPDTVQGSGDVLSHLNCHHDYNGPHGTVHVSTVPNPSHLEVAGAVACGKARARSATLRSGDYSTSSSSSSDEKHKPGDRVLALHFHGDGAFNGQGAVWETSNMSAIPHFRVGGSIHLIANNQVAFTAERHTGRSSLHCTDLARAIDSPILHVNGDSPEDVVRAADLALKYRDTFRKDIYINMICYRRHGHNEIDNPSFTQPRMYTQVHKQPSIADSYAKQLVDESVAKNDELKAVTDKYRDYLDSELKKVDDGHSEPSADHLQGHWKGYEQAPVAITTWDTGVDIQLLKYIGAASVKVSEGVEVHAHLQKTHVDARLKRLESGDAIDWATAEALAFGSLLLQGYDVRVSGQDVGRATFSHRHALLVAQNETADPSSPAAYMPLNHISPAQSAHLEMANSPLSEEAIVGFEYGYTIENPRRLVIWEAQFGDFYNSAQVQIDTLVASGESKWLVQSGLVLALPHGFDGAGPDHSSAHIERFLQLTDSRESQQPADGDNVNMHVVNPSTASQYFHLLRRQCLTPFRKPLILISPKVLLRHPAAASSFNDFAPGTHFKPVLLDQSLKASADSVTTVAFVSGKHAVTLETERNKRNINNLAVVRLERLCPYPIEELQTALSTYKNAKCWSMMSTSDATTMFSAFVWSQEEPRNAGAWSFVKPRFENALGIKLQYAGRPEIAWFATSIAKHHEAEAKQVLEDTFAACK